MWLCPHDQGSGEWHGMRPMKPMRPTWKVLKAIMGSLIFILGLKKSSALLEAEGVESKKEDAQCAQRKNRSDNPGDNEPLVLLQFQVQEMVVISLKRQIVKGLECQAQSLRLYPKGQQNLLKDEM